MKITEIKNHLRQAEQLRFILPDGSFVPTHFHVTEVGKVTKDFIDCGGTVRHEQVANFQLWTAYDTDHQLKPEKLINIIELSEKVLELGDLEIEVEYQSNTIGKYGLEFDGINFLLTTKQTDCLAKDNCGVPQEKPRIRWSNQKQEESQSCCTPDSGCC